MKKTFNQIRDEIISEQQELIRSNQLITESDLEKLPVSVVRFLRKTGAVGKPVHWNADVHWDETFLSLKLGSKARKMTTFQFLSNNPVSRAMLMKIHGLPFQGIDTYHKGVGKMKGKLFGLFTVVDAEGKEMNISELITIFTEIALLNSFFLSENVRYEAMDENRVKVYFTDSEITVSGIFTFDDEGLISKFETNERFRDLGKEKLEQTPFLTRIKSYKQQNDLYLPSEIVVSWLIDGQEFEYFTGTIKSVDFNVTK